MWFYICFKIVAACLLDLHRVLSNLVLKDVSQDADSTKYFLSLFKIILHRIPSLSTVVAFNLPILFEGLFPYFLCAI